MSNLIIHEQLITNCPYTKYADPIVKIIYLWMSKEITITKSHKEKFGFAIFRIWKLHTILPRQRYEDFNGLYDIENWRTLISWYVIKKITSSLICNEITSFYLPTKQCQFRNRYLKLYFAKVIANTKRNLEEATWH